MEADHPGLIGACHVPPVHEEDKGLNLETGEVPEVRSPSFAILFHKRS
jgi:hypothetical protein